MCGLANSSASCWIPHLTYVSYSHFDYIPISWLYILFLEVFLAGSVLCFDSILGWSSMTPQALTSTPESRSTLLVTIPDTHWEHSNIVKCIIYTISFASWPFSQWLFWSNFSLFHFMNKEMESQWNMIPYWCIYTHVKNSYTYTICIL